MRLVERSPEVKSAPIAAPEPEPVSETRIESIADIIALADANRDIALKVQLKRCVRPVRIEPGFIEVSLTDEAPKMLLNDLSTRLQAWTGRRWVVSLSSTPGSPTLAELEADRRENAITDAKADPAVAAILARFPGARIIDVRIPDASRDETDLPPAPEGASGEDDDDEI